MPDTLYTRVQNWIRQDPDNETRTELQTLLERATGGDAAADRELAARFSSRLQFGTAGLRGRLQAGPNGMNRVLVAQAAAGLAAYLNGRESTPSVVIGYDGRKNSETFARDTAEIMAGAGIRTLLLPRLLPTPVLAFAVKYFDASAGVMVTASHNPPEDNGYKVYLGKENGGGQIVPPADADIAAQISLAAERSIAGLPRSREYTVSDERVVEAYIRATAKVVRHPPAEINYVYTAMHGVGKEILLKTFAAAKLPLPHLVAEQAEPDGRFPTVSFPNPEEKGALDLAVGLAGQTGAELIIANDPDADRLAVAIPDGSGGWTVLHGNTIGCLLAWQAARQAAEAGRSGTLACSLVSTPALAEIAARYGLNHQETLTGFKYIAKVPNLIYGFEEALGYLVDPDKVRDKDGISAAAAFLDLAGSLKAQGKTIAAHIAEFAAEFGAYASGQISLRMDSAAALPQLMATFRAHPPAAVGSSAVIQTDDHLQHPEPADILVYRLDGGSRLIVRPSGTEPKVKVYLDVKGRDTADAGGRLAALDAAMRTLLRSETYGSQNC